MRVYAATTNAGKLRELQALFASAGWEIVAFEAYAAPDEGEASYADNAALKARALAARLREAGVAAPVVADDSGIEVTALGGAPGVLSARYGGEGATWADRRRLLREALAATGSADRSARFVCAVHFIAADGREFAAEGTVEGAIVERERGDGGFSYDAVFLYPPAGKTFAELTEEEKNAVSHRRRAADRIRVGLARTDA